MLTDPIWYERVLNLAESSNELAGDDYVEFTEFTENLQQLDASISGKRIGAILHELGFNQRKRGAKGMRVYLSAETIARARDSLKKLKGGEK
jgi:hypothetical protein